MTDPPEDAGGLSLTPLPERLRQLRPAVPEEVLVLVEAEHQRWRQLHDRLIAMIASLIDVAAADRPLLEVIQAVVAGTSVPLDSLVDAHIDPADIAGLLRTHGSTGSVTFEGDTTTFEHDCGTGLRYWRDNPDTPKVAEGEVPGVPAGRPRYCARCMYTIAGHGAGAWTVTPPADLSERCTWTVTQPPFGQRVARESTSEGTAPWLTDPHAPKTPGTA